MPFEATKQELRSLFSSYGQLRSLRLPLKFDRSHRGYCFAEYVTLTEARKALQALQHAHLYGRHLVIEYANDDDELSDTRKKTTKRKNAD